MKIWHKPYKIFVILLFLALLTGGLFIYYTENTPDRCALCADYIPYEAPVILNLSTGEMAELQVFDPNSTQQTGYSHLFFQAGVNGFCDGGVRCHVTLPEQKQPINKRLYCRSCRARLTEIATEGFALLDFTDPAHFKALPIVRNSEYTIGNYAVKISVENGRTTVAVELCYS